MVHRCLGCVCTANSFMQRRSRTFGSTIPDSIANRQTNRCFIICSDFINAGTKVHSYHILIINGLKKIVARTDTHKQVCEICSMNFETDSNVIYRSHVKDITAICIYT